MLHEQCPLARCACVYMRGHCSQVVSTMRATDFTPVQVDLRLSHCSQRSCLVLASWLKVVPLHLIT
jgi:hypothetical protein